MHHDGNHILESLGVKLPEDYRSFMRNYGQKLAEDPINQVSWVQGLGNSCFVVGNTEAFRSTLQNFPKEGVIIGYAGTKHIREINEDIDVFVMLDGHDAHIYLVDSLGAIQGLGQSFSEWASHRLKEAILKDKYKSAFFAIAFDHSDRAAEVRGDLLQLQREHSIDLEDAVVVVREATGKLKVKHLHPVSTKGVWGGSLTGLLVGSLFFHPLLGAVVGAAAEAFSAALADLTLDEPFIREIASVLEPNTSALFVLVKQINGDKIREYMEGTGGKVLMTSLTEEQETALQKHINAGGKHDSEPIDLERRAVGPTPPKV